MRLVSIVAVFILACALLAAAGCTGTQNTGGQGAGTSNAASGSPGGQSGVTGAGNLVPSPTDVIPSYNMVTVNVGEKDYLGTIPVIFQGGMGQIHVTKITATIYRSDGTQETDPIGANKGDEADLRGTKLTDRVVVYVSMDNGQTYKTNDILSEYRTRG